MRIQDISHLETENLAKVCLDCACTSRYTSFDPCSLQRWPRYVLATTSPVHFAFRGPSKPRSMSWAYLSYLSRPRCVHSERIRDCWRKIAINDWCTVCCRQEALFPRSLSRKGHQVPMSRSQTCSKAKRVFCLGSQGLSLQSVHR